MVLGATLLATPFTIRLLGPARYGVWSVLQNVMRYVAVADIGMATVSTTLASERHARRDPAGEAAVVWGSLAITVALTGVVAIGVGLGGPAIVSGFFHVRGALRADSLLALRIICVATVAYAVTGVVSTPQQVRLRWRSLTVATSGPLALQIAAGPIVLVATTGGVAVLAAVVLVAAVGAALLNFATAVRLQPALRKPSSAANTNRALMRVGAPLALSMVAAIPLMTAERLMLAHFQSPTTVAYYAVAAALAAMLAVIPAALAQPLLPALAGLAAGDDPAEHRRLYHQALRVVFLLITPATLALAFLGRPFLTLWAGSAYGAHSAGPFYVLLGGVWFNALAYIPFSQLVASGRTATLARIHLAELLPYLVGAAALTSAFGALGAACAWSGRVIIDALAFFAATASRDEMPWLPTPSRRAAQLALLVALAASFWGLSTFSSSLLIRGGWTAIALALYGLLAWRVVLTSEERQVLTRLRRTLRPQG